jgi:hypothetical protein
MTTAGPRFVSGSPPTILGKDKVMHAMTLHAQADLWQHEAATFAALFMEGEMRSPDTEVDRTGVLLFAGDSLGLRDHAEDRQANPGQRSAQAAERGELAAGTHRWQLRPPHARHIKHSASISDAVTPFGARVPLFGDNHVRVGHHHRDQRELATNAVRSMANAWLGEVIDHGSRSPEGEVCCTIDFTEGLSHAGFHASLAPGDQRPARSGPGSRPTTAILVNVSTFSAADPPGTDFLRNL